MEQNRQSSASSPAQLDREEAIFNAARTLPVADRAAYLKAACGEDTQLLGRISKLLESHGRAGDLESNARRHLYARALFCSVPRASEVLQAFESR